MTGNAAISSEWAMDFRIRPSRPADAVSLPALERSAGELFRTIPVLASIADADDHSAETHLVRIRAGTSWVAVDQADVAIGFLMASVAGRDLHVEELAVRLDRQRAGCGRALLSEAIAWARARGLQAVTLTTFCEVPWNAPYYLRMGFRLLSGDAVGGRLADVLRQEAERGLPMELRCAMRLDLR